MYRDHAMSGEGKKGGGRIRAETQHLPTPRGATPKEGRGRAYTMALLGVVSSHVRIDEGSQIFRDPSPTGCAFMAVIPLRLSHA